MKIVKKFIYTLVLIFTLAGLKPSAYGSGNFYINKDTVFSGNTCYAFFDYFENSVNPLNYQFIDLSTGNINTWEWDFGDGTYSYLSNPEHTYSELGEFLFACGLKTGKGFLLMFIATSFILKPYPIVRHNLNIPKIHRIPRPFNSKTHLQEITSFGNGILVTAHYPMRLPLPTLILKKEFTLYVWKYLLVMKVAVNATIVIVQQ